MDATALHGEKRRRRRGVWLLTAVGLAVGGGGDGHHVRPVLRYGFDWQLVLTYRCLLHDGDRLDRSGL